MDLPCVKMTVLLTSFVFAGEKFGSIICASLRVLRGLETVMEFDT